MSNPESVEDHKEWLALPHTQELLARLDQKVQQLEHHLRAKPSWDDYKEANGEIEGLEMALRYLRENE